MRLSKRIGIALALATVGGLVAAGCNDTTSSCVSACQHELSCATAAAIDAGLGALVPDAGTACQDACNNAADAGYNGCKNPSAGYDCVAGLQCGDLLTLIETGQPTQAVLNCVTKAECPDAG
jgi:hypothetical protein